MSIETSKQFYDYGEGQPSLASTSLFISFLSLKPHQARRKINIGRQFLSFVALYSHLLLGDIYWPFIITPVYIIDPSHIVFGIANIGKSYVSLCGIQDVRATGECAIRRCLRVLKIFQAVESRTPISEELRYSRAQATTHVHHIYRYPYITTCLALGMSFDPDIAYACHSA